MYLKLLFRTKENGNLKIYYQCCLAKFFGYNNLKLFLGKIVNYNFDCNSNIY
jgi:hypothetical protein